MRECGLLSSSLYLRILEEYLCLAAMNAQCPVCKKKPMSSAPLPFCSKRCQSLDLGNWLDERYRVVTEDSASVDAVYDEMER